VHLIGDEIMTGFGRTGQVFAYQHAGIEPDFLCLAKGLTAGWLPMSAVLTSTATYQLCYDDYHTGKAFLHSHTHSGNALAAAVALECLTVMEEEGIYQRAKDNEPVLKALMQEVADSTKKLLNTRHIGSIVAADLDVSSHGHSQRWGYEVGKRATQLGALLRPIGNTLYWLPPLNIEIADLEKLRDITIDAIKQTLP